MQSRQIRNSVLVLALLAVPFSRAMAQDDAAALKAELEALKETVRKLETRIDALTRAEQQPPPAPAVTPPTAANPITPQSVGATGQSTLKPRDQFSNDQWSAPRPNNEPLDPEMKGFLRLPGTESIVKLDGYFKMDVIHDLKYPGNPDLFVTSAIPVGPFAPTSHNTNLQFKQSRISFELRRDSALGPVRFFYENDFFGTPGGSMFNLRNAYAQLGNALGGVTYSTFMDPDALLDTLDYEGPGSTVYTFQPQFRYTVPLGGGQTIAFAAEKPSTDLRIPEVVPATPLSPYPDGVIQWRLEGERGHLQAAALFRDITVDAGSGRHLSTVGYGFNLSGAVSTYKTDNVLFQVTWGKGISRYIADTEGLGLDAAVGEDRRLHAAPLFGTYISYQHYWNPKWRSNFSYGYLNLEPKWLVENLTLHKSAYASGNLLWRGPGSLLMGIEYIYGWQRLTSGDRGIGSRIQFSTEYNLIRRERLDE